MQNKTSLSHEGQIYFSLAASADYLSISVAELRSILVSEKMEWINARENGPLYVSEKSMKRYLAKQKSRLGQGCPAVQTKKAKSKPKLPAKKKGIASILRNHTQQQLVLNWRTKDS